MLVFVNGKLLAEGPIHNFEKVFEDQPLTLELNVEPIDDKLVSLIQSISEDVNISIDDHEKIFIKSNNDIRTCFLEFLA